MFAHRPKLKISTYSPVDAKLRRLLIWHQHHGNQNKLLPLNQRAGNDASKLTLKEKKKWINILTEEEASWRNEQELAKNNLQPITNFFKPTIPQNESSNTTKWSRKEAQLLQAHKSK